jgi:hypothetical protein
MGKLYLFLFGLLFIWYVRLSHLCFKWNELPLSVRMALAQSIQKQERKLSSQSICNIILGYAIFLLILFRFLICLLVTCIFFLVSRLSFSLGAMRADWSDLPVRNSLYSEVERLLPLSVNSQFCSSFIYGYCLSLPFPPYFTALSFRLALCDAEYISLPENRNHIFSLLLKKAKEDGITQGISNIILGLSKMDVSWDELNDEMCLSIEKMINDNAKDFQVQVSYVFSLLLLCSLWISLSFSRV